MWKAEFQTVKKLQLFNQRETRVVPFSQSWFLSFDIWLTDKTEQKYYWVKPCTSKVASKMNYKLDKGSYAKKSNKIINLIAETPLYDHSLTREFE